MDYTSIPITESTRGGEAQMLLFALDRVHRQLAWKTGGLSPDQMRQQHPPSRLTLAGILLHLAGVEERWTSEAELRPPGPPWDEIDLFETHPRWDWETGAAEPERAQQLWYATIADCRQRWERLAADGGLDETVPDDDPAWVKNRRRLLVDILEENLLHTGQASVVREAIDGLTGNDPP